jgi:hypothetical protein
MKNQIKKRILDGIRRRRPPRQPRPPRDGPIRKLINWGRIFGMLRGQPRTVLVILGIIMAIVWYFSAKQHG